MKFQEENAKEFQKIKQNILQDRQTASLKDMVTTKTRQAFIRKIMR